MCLVGLVGDGDREGLSYGYLGHGAIEKLGSMDDAYDAFGLTAKVDVSMVSLTCLKGFSSSFKRLHDVCEETVVCMLAPSEPSFVESGVLTVGRGSPSPSTHVWDPGGSFDCVVKAESFPFDPGGMVSA